MLSIGICTNINLVEYVFYVSDGEVDVPVRKPHRRRSKTPEDATAAAETKKELKPSLGDLVLVKDSENEKRGIYGVVTKLESEGTAVINTRKGEIKIFNF